MGNLRGVVASHLAAVGLGAIITVGISDCNEDDKASWLQPYFLDNTIDHAEAKASERLRKIIYKKPEPKKEVKRKVGYCKDGKCGVREYIERDLPPKIEKVEVRKDWNDAVVKIRNEGLNSDYLKSVSLIDLKEGVVSKVPEFILENAFESRGGNAQAGRSCWQEKNYCSFRVRCSFWNWFDKEHETDPRKHNYVIEVKDHYHTVRSEPFTIRIEEAK